MYGNYCGPGWSNGTLQSSVCGTVKPINKLDALCRRHDCQYATGYDLRQADLQFASNAIDGGFPSTVFGLLVGAQGLFRADKRNLPNQNTYQNSTTSMTNGNTNNKTRRAKAASTTTPRMRQNPALRGGKNSQSPIQTQAVGANYGSIIRLGKPTIRRSANGATISGREFAGNVHASISTGYAPAGSIPMNPAYFNSAQIGNTARGFEKYRFISAILTYVPSVATITAGQLVMTSSRSIKEPFLDGSTATFLSRALTQGNAVACALWQTASIGVDFNDDWKQVDPLVDQDLDDSISEEVQLYVSADDTQTSGIIIMDYEIEFKDPIYQPHATSFPIPIGLSSISTLVDDTAANATTDAILLNASTLALVGDGTIYRCVFVRDRSQVPVGPATFNAAAKAQLTTHSTTTVGVGTLVNLTMPSGCTLYGLVENNLMSLYLSLETARAGSSNGQLFYQTATTVAGAWVFLMTHVGLAPTLLISQQ